MVARRGLRFSSGGRWWQDRNSIVYECDNGNDKINYAGGFSPLFLLFHLIEGFSKKKKGKKQKEKNSEDELMCLMNESPKVRTEWVEKTQGQCRHHFGSTGEW